jgi:hypothetical protein
MTFVVIRCDRTHGNRLSPQKTNCCRKSMLLQQSYDNLPHFPPWQHALDATILVVEIA